MTKWRLTEAASGCPAAHLDAGIAVRADDVTQPGAELLQVIQGSSCRGRGGRGLCLGAVLLTGGGGGRRGGLGEHHHIS